MPLETLPTWEMLQKMLTWEQLDFIHQKKVLDFGSGKGTTAAHFAIDNEVVAIEPNEESIKERDVEWEYQQICGSLNELKELPSESFDVILCHNVLEYATEREEIVKEFARLLKMGGTLSILKHNRAGRVMQMAVLCNDFKHAGQLLDGEDGVAALYGTIHYYEDEDLISWCDSFRIKEVLGMRTFWDLQQNQEIQKEEQWQQGMLDLERRVSKTEPYRQIAFFHHIILVKEQTYENTGN